MRASERVVLFGGLMLALGLGFGFASRGGASATPKIATIDIYVIAEKLMARPELDTPRSDLWRQWQDRANAAQSDLGRMQSELQIMPQSDPKRAAKAQEFQAAQGKYQELVQKANEEVEGFRAKQLLDCYAQIRRSADAAAERGGYTHVFVTRLPDAPMQPQSIALAIQEFLARPLIKSDPTDDLTKQVMADLKLE